jgi:hypothetical protein
MSINNLVTSKAGSVVAEGLKLSLATPAASLTPSTITAMVGIHSGQALQMAPDVTAVTGLLSSHATMLANNAAFIPGVSGPGGSGAAALASLSTLQSQMMPSGNHAALGSLLNQAQAHIADANDLLNTTNFISTTSFGDFGSGITNMSSMLDQGLTGELGSLSAAGAALTSAGSMFDGIDPKNIGSPAGLVQSLNANKLGNASGLNAKLEAAGVDLNNLENPEYADKIAQVTSSIKDPAILKTVASQFGNPLSGGSLPSLGDLGNITKNLNPANLTGLKTDAAGIAQKFSDMGAKFPNMSSASNMLSKISIPEIPSLDAAVPDLGAMMGAADISGTLKSMTGADLSSALSPNLGPGGLPSMTDFTQSIAGGPAFTNILSGGISAGSIAALAASTAKSQSLLQASGIDLSVPPLPSLGASMNFATSLHKFGTNSEISGLLGNMAVPGNKFGDSIKASLAEGKNKALMLQNGIPPLNFNSLPSHSIQDPSLTTKVSSNVGAVVTRSQTVTDIEGGSWQVVGTAVTNTGNVDFKIIGSTGSEIASGSASSVIGLLNRLPKGEDDFIERVISTIRSMESSLKSS